MEIEKIVKGVWYDGKSFFCEYCGKAVFDTKQKAIGHLAQCPERPKDKKPKSSKWTAEKQALLGRSVVGQSVGDLAVSGRSVVSRSVGETQIQANIFQQAEIENPVADNQNYEITLLKKQVAELQESLSYYSNERPHLNAIAQTGVLGVSKEIWIGIAIVGYLLYSVAKESTCHCPVGTGTRTRRFSSIKDKFIDKGLTYGINKLLK